MEKYETFLSEEEALTCQSHHRGAEITAREGHPVMLHGEMTYAIPEDHPSWTVWWDDKDAPTEEEAKALIERFAQEQQHGRFPCPRCGRQAMDEKPVRNATSRRASVYICDRCGMAEALEDMKGEKLPLSEWCIASNPLRWRVGTLRLTFVGRDSWSRPVYENAGQLYVDVDPRKDRTPDICTKCGNAFDGEPDTPIPSGVEVEFLPERDTW